MRGQPQVIVVDNTRTEHVSRNVTVHEHRAPTDQSVALLAEMQAKAEAKVVHSVHVGNTTFECVIHCYHEPMSDEQVMRAVFKLNGMSETAEHRYRARYGADAGQEILKLADAVAKVIASRMIVSALATFRLPPTV